MYYAPNTGRGKEETTTATTRQTNRQTDKDRPRQRPDRQIDRPTEQKTGEISNTLEIKGKTGNTGKTGKNGICIQLLEGMFVPGVCMCPQMSLGSGDGPPPTAKKMGNTSKTMEVTEQEGKKREQLDFQKTLAGWDLKQVKPHPTVFWKSLFARLPRVCSFVCD